MEKINIAEILKDCPNGMELDYALFEDTIFIGVEENKNYPIIIKLKDGSQKRLTKYGCHSNADHAKCVIFPKGKTTWDGFQRPFKDGDILATDLGSVFYLNTHFNTYEYYGCYVGIGGDGSFHICEPFAYQECCGLATEEEKQKLFNAIKTNGYSWNDETKTLEKLVEPKFALNSIIRLKGTDINYRVEEQKINRIKGFVEYEYKLRNIIDKSTKIVYDVYEDDYELVPNKFDISKLKPFESRVLVRNEINQLWIPAFWGYKRDNGYATTFGWSQHCIPYEGNEHLLNTANECDNFFKVWEES